MKGLQCLVRGLQCVYDISINVQKRVLFPTLKKIVLISIENCMMLMHMKNMSEEIEATHKLWIIGKLSIICTHIISQNKSVQQLSCPDFKSSTFC